MSWIAVDTGLGNHHKMAELPNDAARWGWLLTLCEAKKQRKPGTFASERHYRHVLARHGKFLPVYIKAGLMDKAEDGSLAIHDWQKHQWAAAKAAQREDIPKTSLGHSEDIPKTIEGQKEDASRAVPVPVLVDVTTEGVQGEPNAWDAFASRTGEVPGPKIRSWLDELAEAHSEARLCSMLGRLPKTQRTSVDYLKAVRDALRAEDFEAEKAERVTEKAAVKAKRAPVTVIRPAEDISPEEAKRLAAEYHAASKVPA